MKLRAGFLQSKLLTVFITGLLVVLVGVITPARATGTCYVDASATGADDGTSWGDAYLDLQAALVDSCTEIWVAAGTYTPDASDRTVSFVLETGTAIYGGFDGTETLLSQRDWETNVTILSGDLDGDDSGFTNNSENSYHVVYATSVNATAVLDGFTIRGGNADGGGADDSGGGMLNVNSSSPTLENLIFTGNSANQSGGGMANENSSDPALTNITFVSNNSDNGGGMSVTISGTPTLTDVSFTDNSAASFGGGLYVNNTAPVLMKVTFADNTAVNGGGGIYNSQGDPSLTNVTFSGNDGGVSGAGGGIYSNNTGAQPTLTNVTFSGNTASIGGGIFNNNSSDLTLTNVIIADSTSGGDCVNNSGTVNGASSNNLIEDASNACGLTDGVNGDIVGTDPNLDVLADNGGSTQTFALLTGSAALDVGTNTGCPATDQRGVARPQNSTCDIGAYELALQSGSTRTVTKLADTNDFCDVLNCSLREAIASVGSGDTITFTSGLSGGTIYLTSTLAITNSLTIDGSALASRITISGNNNFRVFLVSGGVTATLNSLIVTQGWFNTDGGAGLVNNGTLTITNSVFSAHTADNQFGGAILNNSAGNLTITGSTFSNNSAFSGGAIANYNQLTVKNSTFTNNGGGSTDSGGAIYTSGLSGTLTQTIVNSTFSGNSANIGGAVWSSRTHTIINSTFSGNVANNPNSGGAIWQDAEVLNYANNIMANSTNGDCDAVSAGNIGTNINNLVEQTNYCAPALSSDPNLGSLANNGGPTQTFALLPGSPAINAGDDTTCAAAPVNNLDQRGIARPNGDNCDIGAYEHVDTGAPSVTAFTVPANATSFNIPITTFTASDDGVVTGYKITESSTPPLAGAGGWTASAPTSFTVATAGSHTLYPWAKDDASNVSAVYGSPASVSVCLAMATVITNTDSGAGTLRQAISDACVGGSTITFDNALSGGTIYLTSTLTLTKDVTIDGSSLASKITLSGDSDNDGDGDVRVIHVVNDPLLNVTLDSLILTKGQATGVGLNGEGGAILNQAYLVITNTTFLNNSATGYGGAISNNRPLVITNSTFSGNSSTGADTGGGAIINANTLTISGSTFSGNTANASTGSGGAIFNAGSPATISNSTFSANSAAAAGAILTTQNLTIKNSTFSGNSATITGGLYVDSGTTNLENTIIANSVDLDSINPAECTNNTSGFGTNIKNLIEDGSCSPAFTGDPNLGTLANNGGPTKTFALLAGSAAINAGNDTTCAASPVSNLDQRGMPRSGNGPHCDIGAYEYQDSTVPTVSMSSTALNPTKTSPITVTVTFSENVINFTAGDITASNAVVSNFTGSGSSYTFRLIPKAPGLVTANIAAGVAQDSAGNLNTAATQFSRTFAPNIYLSFIRR